MTEQEVIERLEAQGFSNPDWDRQKAAMVTFAPRAAFIASYWLRPRDGYVARGYKTDPANDQSYKIATFAPVSVEG